MNLENLVAADSETHRIQDGLLAPPGVCWSYAGPALDSAEVLEWPEGLDKFEHLLRNSCTIAGANIAYDNAVACATAEGGRWKGRPELIKLVFSKYERGEFFDVLIGTALDAVASGNLFKDPKTGKPIRYPPTPDQIARGKQGKVAKRYSLEIVTRLLLGRENAKINDEFREKYHTLEDLPIDEWPEVARQYPKDDARNTWDDAAHLLTHGKNLGPIMGIDGKPHPVGCTHMTFQARAAWAMHLIACEGLRTDGVRVGELAEKIETQYQKDCETFKDSGILRKDGPKAGKRDTAYLKRLVITAYANGATSPCGVCEGTGKVEGKRPKPLKDGTQRPGKPINCKTCGGAGLALPATLPLTDTGGVSCSRDTLSESGDDLLEAYAGVSNTVKLRGTYLPFMQVGVRRPINVKGNVIVESGRASFDGLIQLLPRGSGIRECFIAREGTSFCSTDYAAIELCTLAQVIVWALGLRPDECSLARAINDSKDPGILHTLFGAKLINVAPAEFLRRIAEKDKEAKNTRQAAKAANFGFPGLMGAAKLTIAKRKEGLRFCIVSGNAPPCPNCRGQEGHMECRRCYGRGALCGLEKVTEWWKRPIPPTCLACIEYAEYLKKQWFEQWPEIREYFEWVKRFDGVDDSLAVIESLGSGYMRGGLHASNLANHGFQHLASMAAKQGLWMISRACYTEEDSPLFGSRPVVFAHDEVLTQNPRQRESAAAWEQTRLWIDGARLFIPDVWVASEPALQLRWHKDAEKVVDPRTGLLVPWEPPCPSRKCGADGVKKACKPDCDVGTWRTRRFDQPLYAAA